MRFLVRGKLQTFFMYACILVFSVQVRAQYTTGRVDGTVTDPSGAAIPNASISLRDLGTNSLRTANSNSEGFFFFAAVPPGKYEVGVQAQGFSKSSLTFTAVTNQTVTQNVSLALAGQSETVEVRGESSTELNTTEAQHGITRIDEEVRDLPSATRSVIGLASYTPGVQPTFSPRGGSLAITSGSQSGSISASGGRARATAAQMDYTDINDWEFGGIALQTTPNEDAVQEFKVLTSNFSADQGIKSNAQIIIVTKSGTNKFHGTAYDFVQNNIFNARDYFDATGKATIIKRNNFGVTAGGPIIKDRTFIFGGYEATRTRGAGFTTVATVPSASARARATDPVVVKLINTFLPMPTAPTSDPDIGTIASNFASPQNSYQAIFKVDHKFSDKHSIAGRYLHGHGLSILLFPALNTLPGFDSDFTSFARNLSLSDTYLFNAKTVNEFRVAYGRSAGLILNQNGLVAPRFGISGVVNFGALNFFPNTRIFNVYQINDVVSRAQGAHAFKFGVDARKIQDNTLLPTNAQGLYTFPSLNAFLAGQPSSWTQLFGAQYRGYWMGIYSLFAQDDWKITPTLTLNVGLRWEIQGEIVAAHDLTATLDPTSTAPIGASGTGSLGALKSGNPSVDRHPFNIAPRLGFAWNPEHGPLVIRGGYGIFYDSFNFTPQTFSRSVPPLNYNFSLAGAQISGANNFDNLFNGSAPIVQQANAQVGTFGTQQNFGDITIVDQHLKNPYTQDFTLGMEYKFLNSFVAEIGYVGTKGTHLTVLEPLNPVVRGPAPATSLADEAARINQFRAAVAAENGPGNTRLDPRFNQVSSHTSHGGSIYHSLQTSLTKSFTKEGLMFRSTYTWSKSIDDASDFTMEQQANDNGYAQQTFNLHQERAVSNFDITHRFALTSVWQFPFYRTQEGFIGHTLGGWSWQTVNSWQTGVPGTILSGTRLGIADVNLDGNLIPRVGLENTRADCVPGSNNFTLGDPSTVPAANTRGVNGAPNSSNFLYVQPLLGNNGSCGRNTARMRSIPNIDWSLFKNIRLAESGPFGSGPWNLQFRSEFYNIFNIPFLTAQGAGWRTVNSPQFGQVNAAGNSRKIQLALKLTW